MKALTIHNSAVTKESLLEIAQQSPATWKGIRIAAGLLILKGWTSSQVAELFDVSRWSAVQWIQRLNNQGIEGLEEQSRPGRPVRLTEEIQEETETLIGCCCLPMSPAFVSIPSLVEFVLKRVCSRRF